MPKRGTLLLVLLSASVVAAGVVVAPMQGAPEPAFEVASIKANKSGALYVGAPGDVFANGVFRYTNVPLRLLIRQAFERPRSDDVRGGPGWLDTERWDFAGRADAASADMLPMLRTLLSDRFRLRYHVESEEGAVYALTLARSDRRVGPSLRPATGSRSYLGSSGVITGHTISMGDLARLLSSEAGRPVFDGTGLLGTYDLELRWAPSTPSQPETAPSDLPDFFTAVREQLGLRLQPSRGPVDRLVIDQVERPTEN